MRSVVITPQIALQLQIAIDEVGLTEYEFGKLIEPDTLAILIPVLLGKSKISPYCPFRVWQEITLSNRIVGGPGLVSLLEGIGVTIGGLGYSSVEAIKSGDQLETYELFSIRLGDIGLSGGVEYETVKRRARILELSDETVSASLVPELLIKELIVPPKDKEEHFHVFTKSVCDSTLLGDVVFSISFERSEVEGDCNHTYSPVVRPTPCDSTDSIVRESDTLIFARKKSGTVGHEPIPARTGMWSTYRKDARYLT